MRIAIVIDDFFPASGGIGRSVENQLDYLAAAGHEVTLIAPTPYLDPSPVVRTIAWPTFYIDGLSPYLSILHFSEREAASLPYQFDVVHSQTERGALILAAQISRLHNIPHVHTFHANIAGTHDSQPFMAMLGSLSYLAVINPLLRKAAKRAPRFSAKLPRATGEPDNKRFFSRLDWRSMAQIAAQVDEVTSPAQYMLDNIQAATDGYVGGHPVPNTTRQPPRESGHGRADELRFLSVGRLAKEKRLDVLVKAFHRANIPGSKLVFVGDGDQRDYLESLAGENVVFRGAVRDRDQVAYEYSQADVMVLSSYRFDVQALVLLEACFAGLPVLYCDDRLHVGVSEHSSLLVQPDIDSLAQGMRRMADANLREELRRHIPSVMKRFTLEWMGGKYVEIYRKAIAKGRRRG